MVAKRSNDFKNFVTCVKGNWLKPVEKAQFEALKMIYTDISGNLSLDAINGHQNFISFIDE